MTVVTAAAFVLLRFRAEQGIHENPADFPRTRQD